MTDTARQWISENAHPLTTNDPQGALTDLRPLGELVGGATIVALGTSSRFSHELSVISHRILRLLVQEHGFRSLALEGDAAASAELDEHVRTGEGDLAALLARARPFWRTAEILGVARWVRNYNRRNPDDLVSIAHAEPGPVEPATQPNTLADIERTLAEDTLSWHERTGDKIVYLGGVAHTLTRDSPTAGQQNAGTRLRAHFGRRYVSVGLTFHYAVGDQCIPDPPADFAEAVLGDVDIDSYFVNLRTDSSADVKAWLDAPTKTRLIGLR
jgi:erythromycin esterase